MFEEIRPYHIGDDVRNMDWKVTSRLRAPHIRTYLEEKHRPIYLFVDQRTKMFFGSSFKMKSVIACELVALGLYIGNEHKDRVGGLVFNDDHSELLMPSSSRKKACFF